MALMVPRRITSSPAISSSRLPADRLPSRLSVPPVSRISVSALRVAGRVSVSVPLPVTLLLTSTTAVPKAKLTPARYSIQVGALKKRYSCTLPAPVPLVAVAVKATPPL